MKKCIIVLCLAISISSFGQKIQIKKGVILRDKEPIAKLTGEAKSVNDTHLTISTLTDEPLVKIDEVNVKFGSFFQYDFGFYNLGFPTLGRAVPVFVELYGTSSGSEKKIIDQLYDSIGSDYLTKDGLNADLVSKFITSYSVAEKIKKDTAYVKELVRLSREKLTLPVTTRSTDAKIVLANRTKSLDWKGRENWRYPRREGKTTIQDIYQDNIFIGVLVKVLVMGYKGPDTFVEEAYYYILRKVDPFTIENDKIELASLASLDCAVSKSLQVEGKKMLLNYEVSDIGKAEMQLIKELIKDGIL